MIAVDTNILVRLLTGDDPKQTAAARSLFAAEPIWIAKTVLLETGWVLRSLYGFAESAIRDAFTKLLGLKTMRNLRKMVSAYNARGRLCHPKRAKSGVNTRNQNSAAGSLEPNSFPREPRAGLSGASH